MIIFFTLTVSNNTYISDSYNHLSILLIPPEYRNNFSFILHYRTLLKNQGINFVGENKINALIIYQYEKISPSDSITINVKS